MSLIRDYKLNGNLLDSSISGNHAWANTNSIKDLYSIDVTNGSFLYKLKNSFIVYNTSNFINSCFGNNGETIWSTDNAVDEYDKTYINIKTVKGDFNSNLGIKATDYFALVSSSGTELFKIDTSTELTNVFDFFKNPENEFTSICFKSLAYNGCIYFYENINPDMYKSINESYLKYNTYYIYTLYSDEEIININSSNEYIYCTLKSEALNTTRIIKINLSQYSNSWIFTFNDTGTNNITTDLIFDEDNNIYFGDDKGNIYHMSNIGSTTPEILWSTHISTNGIKQLQLNNSKLLFVLDSDNTFYEIDTNNYNEISYYHSEDSILYFTTDSNASNIYYLTGELIKKKKLTLMKDRDGIIGDYCYKFLGGNSNIEFYNPFYNKNVDEFSVSMLYSPINYNTDKSVILGGTSNYEWDKIVYSESLNLYIAFSVDTDTYAISNDTVSWTKKQFPVNYNFNDIVWIDYENIFAVTSPYTNNILYSSDGIKWKEYDLNINDNYHINKIYCYNKNINGVDFRNIIILLKNSKYVYINNYLISDWSESYFEIPDNIGKESYNLNQFTPMIHQTYEYNGNNKTPTNIINTYLMFTDLTTSNIYSYNPDTLVFNKITIDNIKSKNWANIYYDDINNKLILINDNLIVYGGLDDNTYTSLKDWESIIVKNTELQFDNIIYLPKIDGYILTSSNLNKQLVYTFDFIDFYNYELPFNSEISSIYLNSLKLIFVLKNYDYLISSFIDKINKTDTTVDYNLKINELPSDSSFSIFFNKNDSNLTINLGRRYYICNFKNDSSKLYDWFSLVITYNKKLLSFYVNGKLRNHFIVSDDIVFNDTTMKLGDFINRKLTDNNTYELSAKINDFKIYDHSLTLKEINILSTIPVLLYKCNNSSSVSMDNHYNIYDNSGYMNTLYSDKLPKYNTNSYTFGINDCFYLTNSNFNNNVKEFTASFWYKNKSDKDKIILGKYSLDEDYNSIAGWNVTFNESELFFNMYTDKDNKYTISYIKDDIDVNVWNNYVVEYNNGILTTYINGKLQNNMLHIKYTYSNDNFIIGSKNNIYSMDEDEFRDFRLYHTSLDLQNILEIYNKGTVYDDTGNIYTYNIEESTSVNENGLYVDGTNADTVKGSTFRFLIDKHNNMWVSEVSDNYSVDYVYCIDTSTNQTIYSYKPDSSTFGGVYGITYDYNNDCIYAVGCRWLYSSNNRIVKIQNDGNNNFTVTREISIPSMNEVSIGNILFLDGIIYVADWDNSRVFMYDTVNNNNITNSNIYINGNIMLNQNSNYLYLGNWYGYYGRIYSINKLNSSVSLVKTLNTSTYDGFVPEYGQYIYKINNTTNTINVYDIDDYEQSNTLSIFINPYVSESYIIKALSVDINNEIYILYSNSNNFRLVSYKIKNHSLVEKKSNIITKYNKLSIVDNGLRANTFTSNFDYGDSKYIKVDESGNIFTPKEIIETY